MEYKDALGNELRVGDRIAAARIGRGSDHGSLGIGTIIKLTTKKQYSYTVHDNVDAPSLRVEWEYHGNPRWASFHAKQSTIGKLENVVRL